MIRAQQKCAVPQKKIHGRSLEIPRLSGGSQKLKSLKESMKLTGISGGWEGVQTKKTPSLERV